jgi:hypothetical protein
MDFEMYLCVENIAENMFTGGEEREREIEREEIL